VSRAHRGAASELLAAAWLIHKGYHVFRALAPSCPVDLIAYRDNETPLRVEVKSASYSAPRSLSFSRPRNDQWDLLIVVGPEGLCVEVEPGTPYYKAVDAVRVAHGLEVALRHPMVS